MLLCTRCHDPKCQRGHTGHPGTCEACGNTNVLVTECDRTKQKEGE